MKLCTFLAIGLAASGLARAADPVDPAALGTLDAMLSTCRTVNPSAHAAYESLRASIVGEQPDSALAALAQTPEYQQAYAEARKKTEAAQPAETRQDCAQLATALGPRARHADKLYRSTKKK